MATNFEIYGEVATDPRTDRHGNLELFLETKYGLEKFLIPGDEPVAGQLATFSPGDRIALEIEREGRTRRVVDARPSYIRGFPRMG